MLKVKDGKLVGLSKDDQKTIFEAFNAGGTRIYNLHTYNGIDVPTLLVKDNNQREIIALIGKDVKYITHLTGREFYGAEGMDLKKFIKTYCPNYAQKIN